MTDDDRHLRERKVSGQDILHGGFLHARRDAVDLPDGGRATREYIVHPGAVMVVPLLGGPDAEIGRVVLERQFRYPIGRVLVEFPAGKKDPGEEALACAVRELREETGYRAATWAHAGVIHPVASYCSEQIDVWFARDLTPGPRALDAGEFLDVISATVDELLLWCRDGTVTDGKTLVAALWLQNLRTGAWSLQWQPAPAQEAAG